MRRASGDEDLRRFYNLTTETSEREEFAVHDYDYYRAALRLFARGGPHYPNTLLLAYHPDFDDEPLAGLIAFAFGREAIYMYGASSDRGREHMPNHLSLRGS